MMWVILYEICHLDRDWTRGYKDLDAHDEKTIIYVLITTAIFCGSDHSRTLQTFSISFD
jgi:hypothetical protein